MRKAGTSPAFHGMVDGRAPSELVTKHELDLPRTIDHAMTAPTWNSEVLISRPTVNPAKRVTVEGIRYVGFEEDVLPLSNACSFDDREILVHVSRTSPPRDGSWQIPEDISAPTRQ